MNGSLSSLTNSRVFLLKNMKGAPRTFSAKMAELLHTVIILKIGTP